MWLWLKIEKAYNFTLKCDEFWMIGFKLVEPPSPRRLFSDPFFRNITMSDKT